MENKILSKIKKMFAMANHKNSNKQEAENAMRMAQKLLDKHNLSMIDLEADKNDVSIAWGGTDTSPWIRGVYISVSRLYGCYYFFQPNQYNYIVGTESDRVTAVFVVEQLVQDIKSAGKGKGVDFKNGASFEVQLNCQKLIEERRKQNEITGTGIALIDVYSNKIKNASDYINKSLNMTSSKSRTSKMSREGMEYGKGLSPNARMSNKRALN